MQPSPLCDGDCKWTLLPATDPEMEFACTSLLHQRSQTFGVTMEMRPVVPTCKPVAGSGWSTSFNSLSSFASVCVLDCAIFV